MVVALSAGANAGIANAARGAQQRRHVKAYSTKGLGRMRASRGIGMYAKLGRITNRSAGGHSPGMGRGAGSMPETANRTKDLAIDGDRHTTIIEGWHQAARCGVICYVG